MYSPKVKRPEIKFHKFTGSQNKLTLHCLSKQLYIIDEREILENKENVAAEARKLIYILSVKNSSKV